MNVKKENQSNEPTHAMQQPITPTMTDNQIFPGFPFNQFMPPMAFPPPFFRNPFYMPPNLNPMAAFDYCNRNFPQRFW